MSKVVKDILKNAKKIAIVSHISPDADALCSSFALKNIIQNNYDYKYVDVFIDGEIGSLYDPIFRDEVVNPTPYNSYDMVYVLDCPNLGRTGKFRELVENTPVIINIDHHQTNDRFGHINFVSPSSSSTCEIVYLMSKHSNHELNNLIAKELYQGIITDTNCFTSNSITKRTHRVVSELLEYKFDSFAIKSYYFKNNSLAKTQLLSKTLLSMKFYGDNMFTTMKIPNELFSKLDASFEDTLGIVDNGINVSGAEVSAILIESEPQKVYVSLRSKGRVNVGDIAKQFNGGGSAALAAFQRTGNIKEIERDLVKKVVPELEEVDEEEIIF